VCSGNGLLWQSNPPQFSWKNGCKVTVGRPTLSAQAIIQAWADLRDLLQRQTFHPRHLEALKTLISSQVSLYVAEPQAKLVVAILSSAFLSQVRLYQKLQFPF
ncbi:hypothetical protein Leryth_010898, partial [Lithospermum erythrorhizon]